MSRPITADGRRAGALIIEQRYREGDSMQFLRELKQNGIEAGATKIQFGIHWDGVKRNWGDVTLPSGCKIHQNRYRMVYYDNGCGMGAEMVDYMAGLLDLQSKDQASGDPHGNFGMGARVSLLPWNKAGVIIASWSSEVPDGHLMWIRYVPDSSDQIGYYEAMTLEWEDDDADVQFNEVAPAELFPEFTGDRPGWLGLQDDGSVGTGTMFLLLGNTGQEHTFLGPEGSWHTHTGPNYLTHRYWAHPPNLDLRYEDPRSSATDSWIGRLRDRLNKTSLDGTVPTSKDERVLNEPVRPVQGIVSGLYSRKGNPKPKHGTIDIPGGGKINVHFMPEPKSTSGGGRRLAERPGIAVLYKGELYHRRDAARDYQRFAVANAKVYRRLSIVIEPRLADSLEDPAGGVIPTGSRTSLHYIQPKGAKGDRPGGHDLPWNEWQDAFANNMPGFVRAAIDSLIDDDDADIDQEIIEQVAAPFMDMFRRVVWVESTDGDSNGTVKGHILRRKRRSKGGDSESQEDNSSNESAGTGQKESDGAASGKDQSVPAALPECHFDASSFSEDEKAARIRIGVKYIPGQKDSAGQVIIDDSFPLMREVRTYWIERFAEQHIHEVEKAVKQVYKVAMACRVGQLLMMAKKSGVTAGELADSLLSNEALTTSLYGLASEHAALKQKTSGYRRLK